MAKKFSRTLSFLKGDKLIYIVLAIVVITLIVLRLALPGIVKNYVNKKLNELPGYTGHVEDVDIHVLRGAYVIKGLLLKKKADPAKYPFLQIRQADLSLEWGAYLRADLWEKWRWISR